MPYYRCPSCGLTCYSAAAYSSASACPVCAAPLVDESKLHLVPRSKQTVRRSLAPLPEAAGEARQAVVGLPVSEDAHKALALVVSELVTNSVLHAGLAPDSTIDLHVAHDGDRVRVAVHDDGPGFGPEDEASPRPNGGLGFVVVDELAETWDVDCDGDGCTVWCVIAVDDASGGVPASARPSFSQATG
jgi:serine/threonine-protein kinase RsbW